MAQISKVISVNGLVKLSDILQTAGFRGGAALTKLIIDAPATEVRVILTDSNVNPSTPATDGVGLTSRILTIESGNADFSVNADTTFLYTASAVNVGIFAFSSMTSRF